MTPEQFLHELLDSQTLKPEQLMTLGAHKKEVTDYLLANFKEHPPTIKYAGSYAKETMIRDSYDLDIVCYFPSSDTRTLKEIRDDVSEHLKQKYVIEDKVSAERILSLKGVTAPQSYHIDIVPGRFISGSSDVFLHLDGVEKDRLQTNLKTHITHIKDSGCVPTIRLVKIWAHRNNLKIKTFVLELFVVEALKGSRSKDILTGSFLRVLEEMKNRFASIELIDPANTGNPVSRLVSATEKNAVVVAASDAIKRLDDQGDLAAWRSVFKQETVSNVSIPTPKSSSGGFQPTAPWLM